MTGRSRRHPGDRLAVAARRAIGVSPLTPPRLARVRPLEVAAYSMRGESCRVGKKGDNELNYS